MPLFEVLLDFRVIGKPAGVQFGINQLAVDAHFETAAVGGNEYQSRQPFLQFINQLVGQTDRFGFIVSYLAVDDFDFHYFTPSHSFLNSICSGVALPDSMRVHRSS